jgi:hypothetical protein
MTGTTVVSHDKEYFKHDVENVEILYTKDNLPFAKHTAALETPLNKSYEKLYGWKLDETLYVGLISDYNQIANGFSTQWPNNRQINYVGGAEMVDYFSTTSWLDTLLYHETAHNYQVNLKASKVSQVLHSIFGNGLVLLPIPINVPNTMENSFMLEGNAVLNESWHGNGGRLYSGRFKVQTLLQAKAGNIKDSEVYNSKLAFPYGEIVYINGGFYNLYIAEKYGIEKAESYFKYHSADWWWPFRTNASMKDALGVNFTSSLNEFSRNYKNIAQNVVLAEGKHLASSQFFSPLGNDKEEIFFVTNESGYSIPELIIIEKNCSCVRRVKDGWMSGRVVKKDANYYTQGSAFTSPLRIHQGLFDGGSFVKEGTESKIVQGYLSDGRSVYFDVASSYSEPQLYVGDDFYTQVNSSVVIDKEDNLYYFKQKEKTRTLYKNKTPLFSYEGFYGIVSDVDTKGVVYFVANSEFGSTLYAYKNGNVSRASKADNVIEARLINDKEVLLAAISEKDYYYVKNDLTQEAQKPYETKLFFEDKEYYGTIKASQTKSEDYKEIQELKEPYNSLLDMHYSGIDFSAGFGTNGAVGNIDVVFGDPLSQNAATLFIQRDDSNVSIAGASYSNSLYLLEYELSAYGVLEKEFTSRKRDYGLIIGSSLPLYRAGYYYAQIGASFYQDYDTLQREPLSFTLTLQRDESHGISMYANSAHQLQLYKVFEREDRLFGGLYDFTHELPWEFYLGFGAKYTQTDKKANTNASGVKMTAFSYQLDKDPSTIEMPSIAANFYAKDAGYGEVRLAKVFNLSAYFFTFPLSLQRESVYTKYRHYRVNDFANTRADINEATLGFTLSTVLLNSFSLPISMEYIYNDTETNLVNNKHLVRVLFGASF